MSQLEIIGVPLSNYVRAVRLLCEEKRVPYTLTPALPHSPEVLKISPTGQIPVIRHGDVALFETKAIATYIDKAFGGHRLLPDDAVGAARAEQWVSYGNAKVDHWIMRQFVVPQVFFDKAKGPDMAKVNAAKPEIEKCLKALDAQLAKSDFLAGHSMTYADLHIAPMIASMQAFPGGKEMAAPHKALLAWFNRITTRPSWAATTPPPRT